MSCLEQQEEEKEVLLSIYEGDAAFTQLSDTVYQYKAGEDGHVKSFVLEVEWGENYPEELPIIHLDAFYNKHIIPQVKEDIVGQLEDEARLSLGLPVTYTLFQFITDNHEDLTKDQPETPPQLDPAAEEPKKTTCEAAPQKNAKVKKEQLTKAQKRKMGARLDNKGELPRGHDWVDVIKHLSQTGRQAQQQQAAAATVAGNT